MYICHIVFKAELMKEVFKILPGIPPMYKEASMSLTVSESTQLLLTPSTLTVNSVDMMAMILCHLLHKEKSCM